MTVIFGQAVAYSAFRTQPFLKVGLGVGLDCFCGTFRFADAAIDTFVGMNDEHILAFVETVHRTHFDAIQVFALDAVFCDDVGQVILNDSRLMRQAAIGALASERPAKPRRAWR